jgi:peptidyl-prolyl cis-trans isomerase B (cyclophilin B)
MLFPEYAPNTVGNFIDRINEGFYDDSPVLAVQEEVFFQAGINSEGEIKTVDENGESLVVENEYSVNMWPFRGAVGSYGDVQGVGDSRFFIINEQPLTQEQIKELSEIVREDGQHLFPEELLDAFAEVGCAVTLSGLFTIFGQTIEGLDIVEKICTAQIDESLRPIEEIRIISIELE